MGLINEDGLVVIRVENPINVYCEKEGRSFSICFDAGPVGVDAKGKFSVKEDRKFQLSKKGKPFLIVVADSINYIE